MLTFANIFSHSNRSHSELFRCLSLAKAIYTAHPAEAVKHGFVPVVSGYPSWVRLLAGKTSPTDVETDTMASVNALLHFVK